MLYYELVWKNSERKYGKNLLAAGWDFVFERTGQNETIGEAVPVIAKSGPWNDWKYRLVVELYRREQLKAEEAADIVGVSQKEIEQYLDLLEEQGKIRQVGDLQRGLFYKVINEG